MNSLFDVVHRYLDVLLPRTEEMKILLVDETTVHIISMAVSQAELLERNVLLVDEISRVENRNTTKLFRCIFFIRPDDRSVSYACEELEKGRYASYSIAFCAATCPDYLNRLAYADAQHLVKDVLEIFCDFCVVNSDAYFIESNYNPFANTFFSHPAEMENAVKTELNSMRIAEGITSVMAAFQCVPFIRFDTQSQSASNVATDLTDMLRNDPELFQYPAKDTVLLILDRSTDPLTPLITPWTYQAMLHEHFGVGFNVIQLPAELQSEDRLEGRRNGTNERVASSSSGKDQEVVVSSKDDALFADNMFRQWGEVCVRLKEAVDRCKDVVSFDRSSLSLEDLQVLVQSVPQNRAMTLTATKHVTLASLMSNIIKRTSLLEVSLLEQEMYTQANATDHWNRLVAFSQRSGVDPQHVLRLCLMYYLRYEHNTAIPNEKGSALSKTKSVLDLLTGGDHYQKIKNIRNFFGEKNSTERLYPATSLVQTVFSHLQRDDPQKNIYAQHEPFLKQILLELLAGRLSESRYRISSASTRQYSTTQRVKNVWVFICGGYTFKEAAFIHDLNEGKVRWTGPLADGVTGKSMTCILGGDKVINAGDFLDMLSK